MNHLEVQKKPEGFVGQPQVSKELGFMDRLDHVNALQFNDKQILHQKI
jgi:hypothetical protein